MAKARGVEDWIALAGGTIAIGIAGVAIFDILFLFLRGVVL